MLAELPPQLRCPPHEERFILKITAASDGSFELACPQGCTVPIVHGIPRFVPSSGYASAFGLQWNTFRQTQLDSYTGTTITRDRLVRCLGGSLEAVRGKDVLECGCGAGRFTEILLSAGARVFACDLSEAVVANYENCSSSPGYFVCQADIRRLPLRPASFDVVLCLGVIQHTPDPEETMRALASYLKPGGMLAIDHYSPEYEATLSRRLLRRLLLQLPPRSSLQATQLICGALWPAHKLLWRQRHRAGRLRRLFLKASPLVDYFDAYAQLGEELLMKWSLLDTHDTLTDRYKHLRSVEEIRRSLSSCGLIELEVHPGGNGVEARARKPLAHTTRAVAEGGRA